MACAWAFGVTMSLCLCAASVRIDPRDVSSSGIACPAVSTVTVVATTTEFSTVSTAIGAGTYSSPSGQDTTYVSYEILLSFFLVVSNSTAQWSGSASAESANLSTETSSSSIPVVIWDIPDLSCPFHVELPDYPDIREFGKFTFDFYPSSSAGQASASTANLPTTLAKVCSATNTTGWVADASYPSAGSASSCLSTISAMVDWSTPDSATTSTCVLTTVTGLQTICCRSIRGSESLVCVEPVFLATPIDPPPQNVTDELFEAFEAFLNQDGIVPTAGLVTTVNWVSPQTSGASGPSTWTMVNHSTSIFKASATSTLSLANGFLATVSLSSAVGSSALASSAHTSPVVVSPAGIFPVVSSPTGPSILFNTSSYSPNAGEIIPFMSSFAGAVEASVDNFFSHIMSTPTGSAVAATTSPNRISVPGAVFSTATSSATYGTTATFFK